MVGDVNPDIIMKFGQFPARGRQSIAKEAIIKLGGSAANTAFALARLGERVTFLGAVGRDSFGDLCENALMDAGVDARLSRADVPTGFTVAVEESDERTMFTFRGANEVFDVDELPGAEWMHISGYWHLRTLRKHIYDVFERAKEMGTTTSFDFGSWNEDWRDVDLLKRALEDGLIDFFFCDEEEIQAFTGMDIERAVQYVADHAVLGLHMGRRGALIARGEKRIHIPTRRLQRVVVKTGAGATWNAGFIWAYRRTKDLEKAGKIGMEIVQRYIETGEVSPT